jgi:hypothetical protein
MHWRVDWICSFRASPISLINVREIGPLKQMRIRSAEKKSRREAKLRWVVNVEDIAPTYSPKTSNKCKRSAIRARGMKKW